MDNKPSPPTTEDPHNTRRPARKPKRTLRARHNSKRGNHVKLCTTAAPKTPAEPPNDADDGEDEALLKEPKNNAPIDAPSTHPASHSSSLATTTDTKSGGAAEAAELEPRSLRPSIARGNDNTRRRRRSFFERSLDAGVALCAISTLLALLLVLDAYEYAVVPGAPGRGATSEASGAAPAVKPTNASAGVPSNADDDRSVERETNRAQPTMGPKVRESQTPPAQSESGGIRDARFPSEEASRTEMQQQDAVVEKEHAIAQTVQKEMGIDSFCPECSWRQTSITCAARFKFIQKVYHNDADDVVKKTLLDQGCRTNGDLTEKEMDTAQLSMEQKQQELEDGSNASNEIIAEAEGVDDTALEKVDEASNLEAQEEGSEQIVETESGIDLFCPECTWRQTSITCEARFKFIQHRYGNDEDDVVKKSLLEQGCKKKSGARRRRRRLLRG